MEVLFSSSHLCKKKKNTFPAMVAKAKVRVVTLIADILRDAVTFKQTRNIKKTLIKAEAPEMEKKKIGYCYFSPSCQLK